MKASGKEDKMHLPGNRPLVLSSLRFLRPPAAGVVLSPLAAVGPLCLGFWSSFVLLSRVGLAPSFSTFLMRPSRKSKSRR